MVSHDERQAFAERFNTTLDRIGISRNWGRRAQVARLFGVSETAAGKWLDGESMPETKRLPGMAHILGCDVNWLLAGQGAGQEVDEEAAQAYEAKEPLAKTSSENDYEDELLAVWRDLPTHVRRRMLDLLHALQGEHDR